MGIFNMFGLFVKKPVEPQLTDRQKKRREEADRLVKLINCYHYTCEPFSVYDTNLGKKERFEYLRLQAKLKKLLREEAREKLREKLKAVENVECS